MSGLISYQRSGEAGEDDASFSTMKDATAGNQVRLYEIEVYAKFKI
jgi:hypothetical protein